MADQPRPDPLADIDAVLRNAMPEIAAEPEPYMPPPQVEGQPEPPEPERLPGALESAHLRDLTAVGRADSTEGLLLLELARRMDEGVGDSSLAGVARQLLAVAADAYRGTRPNSDVLDELEARRAGRVQAAGAS